MLLFLQVHTYFYLLFIYLLPCLHYISVQHNIIKSGVGESFPFPRTKTGARKKEKLKWLLKRNSAAALVAKGT